MPASKSAHELPCRIMRRCSTRDLEILALFCRGLSYARIAEAVRPVTIRNAIYGIQGKLGFDSKQEVVVLGGAERTAG